MPRASAHLGYHLTMATSILTLIDVTSANSLGILLPAFNVVQQMADTYEHIKFGQKRCKAVIQRAALIIKDVHHGNPQDDQSSVTKLPKYVHAE